MSRQTIHRRLLTDQILLVLLLGGGIMATTFLGARRAVESLSRAVITRAADQAEVQLRRFFDPVAGSLEALASWAETGQADLDDPDSLRRLLLPIADRLPQISGALLADGEGREHFMVRSDGGWRSRLTLPAQWPGRSRWLTWPGNTSRAPKGGGEPAESWEESDYDPRARPWYQGARERPETVYWTAPYRFFTGDRPGVSAAITYDLGDGVERVAAFDVELGELLGYSRAIEVSERGDLWLLTEDRRLLAWPDDPDLWQGRDPAEAMLRSPRELGLARIDDAIEALERTGAGRAAVADEGMASPIRFASGGEDWWILGRPFALSGDLRLLIGVVVPHADLVGDRQALRRWILGLTLAALVAAMARAAMLARRFSRPIEALVEHSDRISRGDLEPGRPIATRLTEVHRLTDAHERMRRGLATLMKLEDDLQLARQIQQKTFPTELPRLDGFDLVAWSRPADETGGDSYDVIGLDGNDSISGGDAERAVLLLADATGHGIGPALSVTQLRAMLRMAVRAGAAGTGSGASFIAGVAQHVNEQLYADLPGNRFITAWLAMLDADASTLTTFSAGQAPLLIYRSDSEQVESLNADAPPLGLLPAQPVVPSPPIEMHPGDVYVVLSDGFFEAVDASGMEFGKERISDLIHQHCDASAADILTAIRDALREFTGDAPLDDDRTAVIVKRTALDRRVTARG